MSPNLARPAVIRVPRHVTKVTLGVAQQLAQVGQPFLLALPGRVGSAFGGRGASPGGWGRARGPGGGAGGQGDGELIRVGWLCWQCGYRVLGCGRGVRGGCSRSGENELLISLW